MAGIIGAVLQPVRLVKQCLQSIPQVMTSASSSLLNSDIPSFTSIRTNVRNHFPRPNEVKRVRRHGWEAKYYTHNGRKMIMRKMLKGRFVLTH